MRAAAVCVMGLAAPLVVWWSTGRALAHTDSHSIFAPVRWLAGEALRHFRLPLWNPYAGTGMPFFAEAIHGVLHPVSVAVAFLFPGDQLEPLLGAYLIAAGLGAFLLARTLGASRPAAITAGLAYGLSGWTLSMTGNLPFLAGAASTPWIVAGLRHAAVRRTPPAIAAAAAAVAAGAFSGDFQSLAVASLLGLALALEAEPRWRGVAAAAVAVAAGGLLAGVQLLPSWSFLQLTDRAHGLGSWDRTGWALSPWRLAELLSPGFFERAREGASRAAPAFMALGASPPAEVPFAPSVFVGAPILVLAAAGSMAGRIGRTLGVAAAALAWLALGWHLGAQDVVDLVPIASGFRFAEKYVGPLTLVLSALAALGADRAVAAPERARRLLVAAVGGLAAVALALAALLASAGGNPDPGWADARANLAAGLWHALLALGILSLCLLGAARGASRAALVGIAALAWAEAVAAMPFALARSGQAEARRGVVAPPLDAAAPVVRLHGPAGVAPRPPRPGWNVFDQVAFDACATGAPACNVAQRMDALDLRPGLTPERFRAVDTILLQAPRADRRYGVTHVVLPADAVEAGAALLVGGRPVRQDPRTGATFWAVPHREWASFAREVALVSGERQALRAVLLLERAGGGGAVVETALPLRGGAGRVLRVARGTERLRIEAESQADSVLVVADAFWPGWKAVIDGRAVDVLAADVLVRAVPWPAGRHVVEMRYAPGEVAAGTWMTVAGVAALAAVALWRRRAPLW